MSQFNKHITKQMDYNSLKNGFRIEYTFIEDEMMKYAQTPVFDTKRELNKRLNEMSEDKAVQKIVVVNVKYFDKS